MIIFMMADESWPCITHPVAPLMLAWLGAVEHGTHHGHSDHDHYIQIQTDAGGMLSQGLADISTSQRSR